MSCFRAAGAGRRPWSLRRPILALLLGSVAIAAPAVHAGTAADSFALPAAAGLPELIAHAEAHNPALAAARHRWQAAAARVPQADALPEPQLGLGLVFDQVDADSEYMGERYSVSQALPWFGKRGLRADVASSAAGAAEQRYQALRLALSERVTAAWFDYAWTRQAVATARENRDLLVRLEGVARALYRSGSGNQADVTRAQVELGRMDDRLRSLLDALGPAAARLNALLGRPTHARLPEPPAPAAHGAPALPERSDEAWLQAALAANPELGAAQREIERETHAVALARKDYYPDIRLGLEYGRNSAGRLAAIDGGGTDMLVGMISVNLPIRQRRYDAAVSEAEARLQAAGRDARSRELALEAELKAALFDYRDGARKLQLYGGTLVPRARHALEATEAAYRAGKVGFIELIDSQRTLLEFELARERAAADQAAAAARVSALAGEPLYPIARED